MGCFCKRRGSRGGCSTGTVKIASILLVLSGSLALAIRNFVIDMDTLKPWALKPMEGNSGQCWPRYHLQNPQTTQIPFQRDTESRETHRGKPVTDRKDGS